MEATFRTLRERIQNGPAFRERFIEAFAREMQVSERLRTEAEEIRARINRLMAVVERGFDIQHVSDRLLQLQDKLDRVEVKIRAEAPAELPAEETIRSILLREINEVELSKDIKRQRMLFKFVLKEIVLTPIPGQRAGETFNVALREAGWPQLWEISSNSWEPIGTQQHRYRQGR